MLGRTGSVVALAGASLALWACGGVGGAEFNVCGTSEITVKSVGAVSSYSGEQEVKLSDLKELASQLNAIGDSQIKEVLIEVVSLGTENRSNRVSGKIEFGTLAGTDRVVAGEYSITGLAMNKTATVTISDEAQTFAKNALKGSAHAFKVWATGEFLPAPADLTIRTRVTLTAKIGSGGTPKDLACVATGAKNATNAPSCDPNPCRNGGTCALEGGTPTCYCGYGFGGLKCELNRVYLPLVRKSAP